MWRAIYKEFKVSIGDEALLIKVDFLNPDKELAGQKEFRFPIAELLSEDAVNSKVNDYLKGLKAAADIIASITAKNRYEIIDENNVVTTSPVPEPSASLAASKTPINKGDTVTLAWSCKDSHKLSSNFGAVELEGIIDLLPEADTEYILTCVGYGEQEARVKVEVTQPVVEAPVEPIV